MQYIENKEKLYQKIDETKSLKDQAYILLTYCCLNKISKWKECTEIANQALRISERINYHEGIGLANLEIGYQNWFSDNYDVAYDYLDRSAKILIQTDNYFKYSRAVSVKASILWTRGNRNEAIAEIFNGLRHVNNSNDAVNGLWLEWFLGIFYFDLKDYNNSEKQYLKALDIIKKAQTNTRDTYAYCLIGYGGVLLQTDREEEALVSFIKAKNFAKENGLWMQEARVLHDLGNYFKKKKNTKKSREYFSKSYAIRKAQNTKPALVSSLLSLAETELNENTTQALQYAEEALQLSNIVGAKQKIKASHTMLSNIYKAQDNIALSYHHLEKANAIEALFSGDKFNSELKNLESQFITELLKRETQILASQNEELKKANEIIKRQYKEISDSIRYAKRIQSAILPPNKLVKEYLNESFIIYMPKDIVAGDFYWMEFINDIILFAVADCTGHGVPGAMISVVCNNALNRVVREFKLKNPADILNKVRELILIEFESEDENFNDGMDISLCALNTQTQELNWAGANSPIWIVKKNNNALIEIKGDKQPIGRYPIEEPFTNHFLKLEKGDSIYIFSDGYADQFGGEFGKKFMRKKFKESILESSVLSLSEQRQMLIDKFENWMGSYDQIDDVCVIGVRI